MDHVVHVGYHKTASTWLQECIIPEFQTISVAESLVIQSLCRALVEAEDEDRPVAALGALLASSKDKLILSYEGLSGLTWDGAPERFRTAERLRHVFQTGVKILIVIRSQPDMLASLYAQYVNEGGTARLQQFIAGRAPGCRFDQYYLEYDKLVGHYCARFGHQNVLVVPYERLRQDPVEFVRELGRLIGSEKGIEIGPSKGIRNPSAGRFGLAVLRVWNSLCRQTRFNRHPLLPLPGGSVVRKVVQCKLCYRAGGRAQVELTEEAHDRFALSNQRLELSLSLNLGSYGYPI